jgi:hypothetical protein
MTHDDDDAHVDTTGAAAFCPLFKSDGTPPDIVERAAWNGVVTRSAAEYAARRNVSVPIDAASLRRLAYEWAEVVAEIRKLREQLGNR